MEKTEYKWVKLLGFKAGLRYFRDTLTDKVAVADNSGKYPDTTDDGVLWLNLDAAVGVELGSREYSRVTVPVKSERGNGKGYYVGEEITHLGEFLPLWTSLGGKVELRGDVNADVLQLLLEHVTRPLQKKCTVCDHFLPPGMVSGCHLIKISGKEIPCFGPEEAATATGGDQPTHADGTIDHGWKATAGAQAQALAEAGKPVRDAAGYCTTCLHAPWGHTMRCPFSPLFAGASAEGSPRPEPNASELQVAKVFDCMRWVCQEARAAVMADSLGKGRLRPALKALADAYEGK
jgi:hypothetical protein